MSVCLPLPSTMVVLSLSMVIFLAWPRSCDLDVLQLDAEIFGDGLAAGQNRDVLQHGLAAIAEARSLDGRDVQRATQLVDDQGRQRFTFHVLGDDHQRTSALGDLLEQRKQVLHRGDLLLVDEDVGVLHHRFHALRIGDEVGRQVAAVELHAFDDFQLGLHRLGLFHGDDAVLANLLHGLGNDGADGLVIVGGDGADLRDHVAGNLLRELVERRALAVAVFIDGADRWRQRPSRCRASGPSGSRRRQRS